MEIPYQKLEPEILRAIIVEFVAREGTDYGDQVYSLDEKSWQFSFSWKTRAPGLYLILNVRRAMSSLFVRPRALN